MKASEIRSKFLNYFAKNGHTIVESSSLVPSNDPTLLFTNAGMVQFKDCFLGKEKRAYTRATTSQKCVRAGGKHNDLESVGFTARHHTFFEMLGNFSFGDYFKKEAIHYAWEFVTQELKLPKDRLYVSVFRDDDEAAEIWNKQEGVPFDRISRFGEKDNFWSMGDTGPCGPCSEIFFDRGEKHSCGKPTCKMGCDCDRYLEFWNLVFMQFDRDSSGKLTPLPKPAVDTGAGLERIAMILQEVDTNYDTDAFQDIIHKTAKLAHENYDRKSPLAASFRVVADHARAATFLIGDGVMPSNEGRGYVLRRIIRRAIRHGKKLGFSGPFMNQVCQFVIEQMQEAYPDLKSQRALIERAVLAEEEQFFKTLERGLQLLEEETAKLGSKKELSGQVAFTLYDTYGFPLDLTRVILSERNLGVDEAGFEKCMDAQRAESRKNWKGTGQESREGEYLALQAELEKKHQLPLFTGYQHVREEGEVLALFAREEHGLKRVDHVTTKGDTIVEAVFSRTPFYAESGGQVGDLGVVKAAGLMADVLDTQKPAPDLIVAHLKLTQGSLQVGQKVEQIVKNETRQLTARNHTATHILHWALREVLGKHVKQAGSLVNPELLRFDFSHFQALSPDEIKRVEDLVNAKIWDDQPVKKQEMGKDQAINSGAIAFFGEKYGDKVRVVSVGDFSVELCGGTHVNQSSDIHLFKIASEGGIAAGVRRIIAYTSQGAYAYLREREMETRLVRERLKAANADDVLGKIEKLYQTEKDLKRTIEQFEAKAAAQEVGNLLAHAKKVGAVTLVGAVCSPSSDGMKKLRDLADQIRSRDPHSAIALGVKEPDSDKVSFVVAIGSQAPKSLVAGEILKAAVIHIDGKGGGKPDFAQAGGTKPAGLAQAVDAALKLIEQKL